jgi:hypothetical protein
MGAPAWTLRQWPKRNGFCAFSLCDHFVFLDGQSINDILGMSFNRKMTLGIV